MKLRPETERDQRLVQGLVRAQLNHFLQPAFKTTHGFALEQDWYLSPVCHALQHALETDSSRLLINIPPRHLKSFTASVCLPAFALGRDPRLKIAIAVYGDELARQHMRPLSQILDARWYRATFPDFRLSSSKTNVLTTSLGGSIRFVTVGGAFTGLGINMLIIDDILKAQDATSSQLRSSAERYVRETAFTRFDDQRRTRVVAISQRLHPYDLSWALAESGFHHINLPSIADRDMELPTYGGVSVSWRTGEPLSQRFPPEVLERLKREIGSAAYSAQYLQAPTFEDSRIVDFARLSFVEEPFERKDLEYTVMSIDPAVKIGDTCDYSAITIFGLSKGKWCLVHAVERRLEFTDLKALIASLAQEWAVDVIVIEDCHTGIALYGELKAKKLESVVWPVDGDKAERLSVAVDNFYAGEVVFPRKPFLEPLFAQFRNFPEGHDDLLDSVTQFVGWLRDRDVPRILDIKKYGRPRRSRT